MSVLLKGEANSEEIKNFLLVLKSKGETAAELAGFAKGMRARMIRVDAGHDVVDNCGTGGDGAGTFNISTTAAFVMAGAGAHVAKHGNRAISSATGSADVLEALGVRVTASPDEAARLIRDVGIGFMFAPAFHPSMSHVQQVRRELKTRTVFNLLGPLANPASARRQVIGTPSVQVAKMMAEALAMLETRRAFVVHGHGGLDEVSTTGPTDVYEVVGNTVTKHIWEPADFGVERAQMSALLGGDAAHNAAIVRAILGGEVGPRRDIVVVNAAAGLVAADLAADLRSGLEMAAVSIDSGAALAKLDALRGAFPA
jgi:anthranilate phosphoribosyltransferase